MKIKRFGESREDKNNKWIEYDDGSRKDAIENDIHSLWEFWVLAFVKVYRDDDKEYTIFAFEEPVTYEFINEKMKTLQS